MSTTDLERRQIEVVPVPAALAEVGIRIAKDAGSGMAVVVIPPQVRDALNVLDPVSSFAQADPNWTPSVRLVQLNPNPDTGPHFYKQLGNKLAPSKQGLETIASAAGVISASTRRVPRDELSDGEAFGFRATVGIRRSDGTVATVTREKTFVTEAEREEIREAVIRSGKFGQPGETAFETEFRKRWLKEQKDAPAKTESKAVNRAIRAILQIPHTFSPQDAAKPFVVIGYSFTPDYSDEETKRILVANGLNAAALMYGGNGQAAREIEASTVAPEDGPEGGGAGGGAGAPAQGPGTDASGGGDDAPGHVASGQQAGAAEAMASQEPAAPVPDFEGEEPPVEQESAFKPPTAALTPEVIAANEAGEVAFLNGRHKDTTIRQLHEAGDQGIKYLRWCMTNWKTEPIKSAVWAYAKVYMPEAYQELLAKQEAEAA